MTKNRQSLVTLPCVALFAALCVFTAACDKEDKSATKSESTSEKVRSSDPKKRDEGLTEGEKKYK